MAVLEWWQGGARKHHAFADAGEGEPLTHDLLKEIDGDVLKLVKMLKQEGDGIVWKPWQGHSSSHCQGSSWNKEVEKLSLFHLTNPLILHNSHMMTGEDMPPFGLRPNNVQCWLLCRSSINLCFTVEKAVQEALGLACHLLHQGFQLVMVCFTLIYCCGAMNRWLVFLDAMIVRTFSLTSESKSRPALTAASQSC